MRCNIDVLIATYNGEKFIEELLTSVLQQTYGDISIIIVDDCSSDRTYEILKNFAKAKDKIRLYQNDKNIGYIKTYERLIELSSSDYFMFADQDDIWVETKIECSYEAIKREKVDVVFTDMTVVDSDLHVIHESYNRYMHLKAHTAKKQHLLVKNYSTGCTMLCSRGLKDKILPFIKLKPPDYIYDWYILMIASINKGFFYLDRSTVLYRLHEGNSIGIKKKKGFYDILRDAKKTRISFIHTRIEFHKQLLHEDRSQINRFMEYLKSLEKTKYVNLHFLEFQYFFGNEYMSDKLKYFMALHFPIVLIFLNKR